MRKPANPAKSLAVRISQVAPKLTTVAFPAAVASLRAAARVPPRRTMKAQVGAILGELRPTLRRIPRPLTALIGDVLVKVTSIRVRRAALRLVQDPLEQPFAHRIPKVREAREYRLNREMWAWMESNT